MSASIKLLSKVIFILVVLSATVMVSCSKNEDKENPNPQDNKNLRIMKDVMENQCEWIRKDLMGKWENNRTYTLEVLKAMPEEHYDFIPTEGMRSFKQQAAHISGTLSWQLEKLGGGKIAEVDTTSKASIIASYETMFDKVATHLKQMDNHDPEETLEAFYGTTTKNKLFNLMDNHVAHHRGQMIVYLRLKGITPPKYIGY